MRVDKIICNVNNTNTKWRDTQPKLVIEGFASKVELIEENGKITATIS